MANSEKPANTGDETGAVNPWQLVRKSVGLLGILLGATLVLIALDVPVEAYAERVVSRGGLIGVFLVVWMMDMFIVPVSMDVFYPFTVTWQPWSLLSVMSVASVFGGACGYWIGRGLYHLPFVQRTVSGYYERGTKIIERYGVWAVVIAGVSPIPFSAVSWIAGMVRMPFQYYILAALSRIPRIVGYWALVRAGVLVFT
ncbi:MAG: VTT domain-containing protein [Spirochaetia bacterium]